MCVDLNGRKAPTNTLIVSSRGTRIYFILILLKLLKLLIFYYFINQTFYFDILLFNLKHNYYNFIVKDMIQHSWQNKMNSHFNFNKQMLSNIWTKNF